MNIIAIDPGSERSAYVLMSDGKLTEGQIFENRRLIVLLGLMRGCRERLEDQSVRRLVVEMVQSYGTGMPVGKTIFDTCVWIGRFIQAWGGSHELISRPTVKATLCGSAKAKDSNVRQALIDRLGPVGTKKAPGPLYGVKNDIWAALAVGVAWYTLRDTETSSTLGATPRRKAFRHGAFVT